jgi:hypothetical protein
LNVELEPLAGSGDESYDRGAPHSGRSTFNVQRSTFNVQRSTLRRFGELIRAIAGEDISRPIRVIIDQVLAKGLK